MDDGEKKTVRIFVSYCHADANQVTDLLERLRLRLNLATGYQFESWDDRTILAGEHWADEIENAIRGSDLGLLFVSYPFLNSHFIVTRELPRFLGQSEGRRPVPVGLSRVPLDGSIDLAGLGARQLFRGPGNSYYDELNGVERNQFADALFREILQICRRHHPIGGLSRA